MRRIGLVVLTACLLSVAVGVGVFSSGDDGWAGTGANASASLVIPPNLAYARIRGDGRVDVSRSRGIDQSMVRYVRGTFCFYLPFRPLHVMAMAGEDNTLGSVAQASITTNDRDCPGAETAHVQMVRKRWVGNFPPYVETVSIPRGALYVVFVRPQPRGRIGATPYVYGRVDAGGRVDAARSSGISDSMITVRPPAPGYPWTYCFYFPFQPKFVFITPEHPIPPADGGTRIYPVRPRYTASGASSVCPGNEVAHLELSDYRLTNNRARVDPARVVQTSSTRPYPFYVFATTTDIPGYAYGNVTSFGTLTSGDGIDRPGVYKIRNSTGLYCLDAPFKVNSALAMPQGQDDRSGRWQNVTQVGTVRGEYEGVGSTDRAGCDGSDHVQLVVGQRSVQRTVGRNQPAPWVESQVVANGAFSFFLIP